MATSETLTLTLIFFLLSISSSSSSPSLSVSPQTLTKSNNTIHIHWSSIASPSDLDWLGIYSPPNSSDSDFIGYLFLNSSPSHLTTGSGSISLPLTNLRSPYSFRIFHWSRNEIDSQNLDNDNNPLPLPIHRLAASESAVRFESESGPDQIHLAFTDRVDEIRVMFVMGGGLKGRVRYGEREGRLEREVGTEVRRYDREDMCDSPANSSRGWRDPGWIHDGVMKGLERGKRYYYQVRFLNFDVWFCFVMVALLRLGVIFGRKKD